MITANPDLTVDEIIRARIIRMPLIFIDEFIKSDSSILLRNLVRTVLLPCVVASTDSKVSNMIYWDPETSRNERMSYCKLVRLFPSASVEGSLKSTSINVADEEYPLFDFIDQETKQIDFERMPGDINTKLTDNTRRSIQTIFELIIAQASTCHQGIVGLCFEKICKILSQEPDTKSCIFKELISFLASELNKKKNLSLSNDKLFYTIFTFTRSPRIARIATDSDEEVAAIAQVGGDIVVDDEEVDDDVDVDMVIDEIEDVSTPQGYAIEAIHNHFYHLGASRHGPGVIDLKKSGLLLYQDDMEDEFIIESYFSDFKENSLMHIALWHSLFNGLNGRTVANVIHEKYKMTPDYWKNAFAQSNASDPQEFTAVFALAHATHKTLPVPIDGMELVETFAKQIQLQTRRIDNVIPTKLKSFLLTIKVPYLIPTDHENQLLQKLRQIMPLGECRRTTRNSEVCFTIQNHPVKGVIECKNREKKISRSVALSYIMKAIESRRPLAILMGKRIGKSLKSDQKFHNFSLTKRSKTDPKLVTECKNANLDQALAFMDIKEPNFKMNIYSLTYCPETPNTLKYTTLHEVPNPQGVFLIVESDCPFR